MRLWGRGECGGIWGSVICKSYDPTQLTIFLAWAPHNRHQLQNPIYKNERYTSLFINIARLIILLETPLSSPPKILWFFLSWQSPIPALTGSFSNKDGNGNENATKQKV